MKLEDFLNLAKPPAEINLDYHDLVRFFWKYKGILKELERDRTFWQSTTENLEVAYIRLRDLSQELEKLSIQDALTTLYNRRHSLELFEKEFRRAKRSRHPLSIAILDLDHFKGVNDTYGHLVGDEVLNKIGILMKSTVRNTDICGRIGGEEFIIICPETNTRNMFEVAEKIRKRICEQRFSSNNEFFTVSGSLGIAEITEITKDIREMLSQADKALYKAKNSGRNMAVVLS